MPEETNIKDLRINYMSQEQYAGATKSNNEIYLVPDATEYAKAADLTSHTSNASNPHGVTAAQVGAAVSTHKHAASDLTSGYVPVARGGTGYTTLTDTVYTTARYRGSALVRTQTTPSANGVINWIYK